MQNETFHRLAMSLPTWISIMTEPTIKMSKNIDVLDPKSDLLKRGFLHNQLTTYGSFQALLVVTQIIFLIENINFTTTTK